MHRSWMRAMREVTELRVRVRDLESMVSVKSKEKERTAVSMREMVNRTKELERKCESISEEREGLGKR